MLLAIPLFFSSECHVFGVVVTQCRLGRSETVKENNTIVSWYAGERKLEGENFRVWELMFLSFLMLDRNITITILN